MITTITLLGTEQDETGAPLSGEVSFTLSAPLLDQTANISYAPRTIYAALAQDGTWNIELVATKGDADVTPEGVTYLVHKRVGTYSQSFSIELDVANGLTQYLVDITPVSDTTITYGLSAIVPEAPITATTVDGVTTVGVDVGVAAGTVAAGDHVHAGGSYDALGAAAAVQTNLTAEAITRAAADTTQTTNIATNTTAIATETTNRTSADTTLQANITAEASTRSTADTTESAARVTHQNLSTGAHGGLVASTDPALTNARTPTAHAASHVQGGSDALADSALYPSPVGYYMTTLSVGSLTTGALADALLTVTPFMVMRPLTLDILVCEVTVIGGAGSVIRLGIFGTTNGLPDALVLDAGTVLGTGVAVLSKSINQVLQPGLYWIGGVSQGAPSPNPTVRISAGIVPQIGSTTTGIISSNNAAYSKAGVSGALPQNFGAPSSTTSALKVLMHISA